MSTVAAIVVATHGGGALAEALRSVSWADQRLVLDPTGQLDGRRLGAGVVTGGRLELREDISRVLLLGERERLAEDAAATVRAAAAGPVEAWRMRRELCILGLRLVLPGAPVRLAPRGAELAITPGLDLALASEALRARRLPRLKTRLRIEAAGTLNEAMEMLTAEARAMAALLAATGARAGGARLAWTAAVAAATVLLARGERRCGIGRFVAAVLRGYRNVVAWTMLWEQSHGRVEVR